MLPAPVACCEPVAPVLPVVDCDPVPVLPLPLESLFENIIWISSKSLYLLPIPAIALAVIGVDYAIVIGIISGICNMIPYVGPMVGTVLAAVMGLLSGEPIMVLWAVIAMLVVQQIDNNLIAPKIVGDSVGLHPVFTMIAIIIGGNIGGLLGMLVAVPLTASIKILLGKWYNQYVDYEREE